MSFGNVMGGGEYLVQVSEKSMYPIFIFMSTETVEEFKVNPLSFSPAVSTTSQFILPVHFTQFMV